MASTWQSSATVLFLRLLGAPQRFPAAGLGAAVIVFYAVMVGGELSVMLARCRATTCYEPTVTVESS